jgi:magnesium transporter
MSGRRSPRVFLFEKDHVTELADLRERPGRLDSSKLLWVDLDVPGEESARLVADELGLDRETTARLSAECGRPAFRDSGSYLHVTASVPEGDDGLTEIECVVGENWIVTAHARPAAVLDSLAELAEGSGRTGELDGPAFLAMLLEWILNEHAMAFERIEERLEDFDAQAMRGEIRPEDEIETLVQLRARIGSLRRALVAHHAPLLALAHPELERLGDSSSAERFRALLDRFESTLQHARDARESVVSSFDVLLARTGHRTNEIVKVLTLASVIFLPGALLAGILGMNFHVGLFEHPALFWVAIAVMAAIAVVTLSVAKARSWI